MFDGEERQGENSETGSSFSLDFFDTDELSKIDLDKYHIESKVRYVTHVSISLQRDGLGRSHAEHLLNPFSLQRTWFVLAFCETLDSTLMIGIASMALLTT